MVRVKCTFQSKLQYSRMQWAVMYKVYKRGTELDKNYLRPSIFFPYKWEILYTM